MNRVLFHLIFIITASESPGGDKSFTSGEQRQPPRQAPGKGGFVLPWPCWSLVPSQGGDAQQEEMQDGHHTLGRMGMLKVLGFAAHPGMGADLGPPASISVGRTPHRCSPHQLCCPAEASCLFTALGKTCLRDFREKNP